MLPVLKCASVHPSISSVRVSTTANINVPPREREELVIRMDLPEREKRKIDPTTSVTSRKCK